MKRRDIYTPFSSDCPPPNQISKNQAQAVLYDMEAGLTDDPKQKFILKYGAILLQAHDRNGGGQ